MPGMGRSLQTGNSLVVSSFRTALFHQLLVVLLIVVLSAIAFNVVRTLQYRRLKEHGLRAFPTASPTLAPEPLARRVVRIGFGCLWVLDGLLQIQSSMPLGLPSGVIQPSAGGSPAWVQHLVNSGVIIWSDHPVEAAAATVWIQLGLGIWLLVAPRGRWSRLGGAASVAWGLLVWMFGEAFGGIFAPGLTWLFGAPGAVIFYCAAGVLIALPERAFSSPRLGRLILGLGGLFLVGMAILQAWPGRGSWQGRGGTLNAMVHTMSETSQPTFLSSWLGSFASFDDAHGWGVNLFVVVSLAGIGALFLTGRKRLVLGVLVAFLCSRSPTGCSLRTWAFWAASAPTRIPCCPWSCSSERATSPLPAFPMRPQRRLRRWPPGRRVNRSCPGRGGARRRSRIFCAATAAVAALAVVIVGTAPMAMAAVNPNADPILSEAVDGTPNAVDTPAPPFALVDQHGHEESLADLRGRVVALTFLDPVCTSDCPLIAQEFRQADKQLGAQSDRVDFVAIVANPDYRSLAFTNAFDRQEDFTHLSNWYYLTGSLSALERVWNSYGEPVQTIPDGAMVAHGDLAFVIDGRGHERDALVDDPGPTQTTASSFSSLLLNQIDQVLKS